MKLLQALLSVALWAPVIAVKVGLILLGLLIVPFYLKVLYRDPPNIWRFGVGRPLTVWEAAIRNPVGGFDYLITPPLGYQTYGTSPIEPTLQSSRLAYRFRIKRLYSSLRLVVRYSNTKYGECYIGWKLGTTSGLLDFALSLRPYATVGQ